MTLDELLADVPTNLSARAKADLVRIVRYSIGHWGDRIARNTVARLLFRAHEIGTGRALGHMRKDIPTRYPVLFVVEPPWVIAYNPDRRHVLRIVHGARDLPTLFKADTR